MNEQTVEATEEGPNGLRVLCLAALQILDRTNGEALNLSPHWWVSAHRTLTAAGFEPATPGLGDG